MADGPPQYDPPPAYRPPAAPAASGSGGQGGPGESGQPPTRRNRVIGALAAAAAVVAAVVVAYLLVSSGSSGAATPRDAVRRLLDAGKKDDVSAATSLLCKGDRAIGQISHLQSSGRITGYALGAQSIQGDITFVAATFSTSKAPVPATENFPVVKESGSWKVCFSRELAGLPVTPARATTAPTVALPSGVPGFPSLGGTARTSIAVPFPSITGAQLCVGETSGFGVASNYVAAAELGEPQIAQACVYRGSVPISLAQRLAGTLFGPVTTDQFASVIVYQSADGSTRVTVTTAKEPDGHYYVTAVAIG